MFVVVLVALCSLPLPRYTPPAGDLRHLLGTYIFSFLRFLFVSFFFPFFLVNGCSYFSPRIGALVWLPG